MSSPFVDSSNTTTTRCPLPHPNPLSSLWLDETRSDPLTRCGASSPVPDQCDVVVVGSGITAINCAYQLCINASSSITVTVVEARSFCSGATGRNGGHLTPSAEFSFANLQLKYGTQSAKSCVDVEHRSVHHILNIINSSPEDDCDLVTGSHTILFHSQQEEDEARRQVDAAAQSGCSVSHIKWLDASMVREKYGATNATGGCTSTGYNLFPWKYVAKLFRSTTTKASLNGSRVQLLTQTPVTQVRRSSHPYWTWTVSTSRGDIAARYVVHATNAYASHLLPAYANLPRAIVPTRAQVVAIRPRSDVQPNPIWTKNAFSTHQGFDYLFQRPPSNSNDGHGQALVVLGGGRQAASPACEVGVSDDSKVNPVIGSYLRSFLPNEFANTWESSDDVHVEQEWTGIMGFTHDHDPVVGPLVEIGYVVPGQYICAGFSGHGMSRAPACAEAVAMMIDYDRRGRKWSCPDWLPPHYLSTRDL